MPVSSRLRGGALVSAFIVAAGLVLPTQALAADAPDVADDPISFDTGHIDAFNVILNEDDSVRLVLKEDVTGSHVLRTPESVDLLVKSQAHATGLPSNALPPGLATSHYHLPLTQDQSLIWPGWDTQSVQSAYPGAKTQFDVDVSGPGDIYVWSQGTFGALRSLLVGGGYSLPGTIDQPFPAHTHAAWGFTEPGTYSLDVTARVASSDGTKTSTSNTATYTFTVAPVTESVQVTGAEDAVEAGSEVVLTAAQTPAESTFSDYRWETRATADDDWASIDGETGATIAVDAVDGAQYRAVVSGGKDYSTGSALPQSFESAPVTISTIAEPVTPEITIAPLSHHYHSGSPVDLAVTAEPAVEDATYRWYIQRTDQDEPVLIEGVSGASHRLTAEQALHDARVTVELIGQGDTVIATAGAVTIDVDDHGAAPLQRVTVDGLADSYDSGETIDLSASVAPASVLDTFAWYVQPEGEDTPVLVEGETSSEYSFPASDDLDGAAVVAHLTYDDGRSYAESAPVIVNVDGAGEIPSTELSISTNRDADDYWIGQTATLTAAQSTPTGLTEHRWLTKLPDADEFTAVDGQESAQYAFKPTLANSGVEVKVQLLRDGEIHAESAPVAITAQQRPVVTTLTVNADKDVYEPGDTATLTSAQSPQTDEAHYHWYVKRAGASDFVWVDQSRDKDLAYPVTAEDDGAQLVIRLFDDTHAVIAESEPYTLDVEAASTDPEPVTELTIEGLEDGYHAGEIASLTAVQTPETDEEHYHWFIQRDGDADFSVISGAFSGALEHEVTEADAGARIVAKLYDHDHQVIAESEPVTLTVLPGSPKPSDEPQAQTEDALEGVEEGGIVASTDTPRAGQVITVQIGDGAAYAGDWVAAWLFSEPVLLGGDWSEVAVDGTIAVTIPADTTLGEHRLAVFDAEGDLIGWQQLQVGAAADGGDTEPGDGAGAGGDAGAGDESAADGDLAATGAEFGGLLAGGLVLLLAGVLLAAARRRSSTLAHPTE